MSDFQVIRPTLNEFATAPASSALMPPTFTSESSKTSARSMLGFSGARNVTVGNSTTDCLLTPESLMQNCQQTSKSELASTVNTTINNTALGVTPATTTSVLMSPMQFEAAAAESTHLMRINSSESTGERGLLGNNNNNLSSSGAVGGVINPLTKEQLQQTLIHMLKTDGDFLCAIHSAYVSSLNQGLHSRSSN